MTAVHALAVEQLGEEIAAGRLRSEDCVRAFLERIESLDPVLRAFTQVLPERAIEQARRADREWSEGLRRGPLHGVPYALKDIIDVQGLPTTANSHVMAGHRAERTAQLAQRLEQAGAVLIGKLNTNEFACGGPPQGTPFPPPRNPWNADYVTGGSSSGCGVALAAQLTPLAIGTDTNGSIRQPAARCGVVGMKPTYGRISRDGVFPLAPTLDHAGPMTRSVAGNAIALAAMAGADPADPTSRTVSFDLNAALRSDVRGLRVGALRNIHMEGPDTDPAQATAFTDACVHLERAGAHIIELELPTPTLYTEVARALMSAEAYSIHEAWLREMPERYGEPARMRMLQGALMSSADYLRAQRLRARLAAEFDAVTAAVDVVLTTACHSPHAAVDDRAAALRRHLGQALMVFNTTGLPALVVPVGLCPRGLPLAVQVAAKAFNEATVYRVGRALELAMPMPAPALALA